MELFRRRQLLKCTVLLLTENSLNVCLEERAADSEVDNDSVTLIDQLNEDDITAVSKNNISSFKVNIREFLRNDKMCKLLS